MRRVAAIAVLASVAVLTPGFAQDASEATRLERLIENALSGAGRDVTVRGFSGALSGRAEMTSLVIADADGPWLTLSDAVLDWNRAALIRGRLEVSELSAARIEMPRRPTPPQSDPMSPEASGTGLSVPDLPVALSVDDVSAETVVLGAGVLGQALTVTLDGSLMVEDGDADARLNLRRTDGTRGQIALGTTLSNATGALSVEATFDEAAGGIAAGLLGLPGAPALRLEVVGDGALDDFEANLALATDGTERLSGAVRAQLVAGTRKFLAEFEGDLRPLVDPPYRDFFGSRSVFSATAQRPPDGTTELTELAISTDALALEGAAVFAADGLPLMIELAGTLAGADGGPLLLPIAGAQTTIARASLDLGFDAAQGEAWDASVLLTGLEREGFSAAELALDGRGTITDEPAVSAALDLRADALDFGRAQAQDAFGEAVTGRVDLTWSAGNPLEIATLELTGESYSAAAEGTIANPTTTLDLDGSVRVRADALDVFSGLAQRPLAGQLDATLTGSAGVFSGLADLRGTAVGRDLATGIDQLDPYLGGQTALELAARRSTDGLFVDRLRLAGPEAQIEASGALRTGEGVLSATADLGDLAPLAEGLAGPAELSLDAEISQGVWTWKLAADAMASELAADGTFAGGLEAPSLTAAGRLESSDLGAFAALARQPLGGGLEADFSARAEPGAGTYGWDVVGVLRDGAVGRTEVDRLLAGQADLAVTGALSGSTLTLERIDITSVRMEFSATGSIASDFEVLSLDADVSLTDVADVAPGLTGPARMAAQITPTATGGPWDVDLAASGPGVEARVKAALHDLAEVPLIDGTVALDIADLGPFATLAERPLSGALALTAEGSLRGDLTEFDVVVDASAENAALGIPSLDRLLRGTARVRLDAARAGGDISVREAVASTELLNAEASGTIGAQTAFGFDARLADIAPFVSGFSGPVTAAGTAETSRAGEVAVDTAITGPAGAQATISGTVAQTGERANLDIAGAAPLGLANGIIAPRAAAGEARFALRLDGPLALESLAGQVTTRGALLTAPVLDIALEDIAATIALAGGRATLDVDSRFRGGGAVRLDGPVGLGAGLPADLALVLDGVRLTDPALYQTRLDARLALTGPLSGGAQITGRVDVGESELQIPSSIGGAGSGLPAITHVGEPAGVRATRGRAGLLATADGQADMPATFGLDVLVNAPNRIFVRGRGLDAELGGQVRLRGTTRAIAPDGRFDLIRGRFDILGRRLDLTRGAVTLTGALDPLLDLVAETQAEDVNVSIILEGPASDPAVRFASQPELPEDEVLALLLFGRGIETLSPLQIARLAGAVATLGSSGGGILGGLRDGVGLADLDVTSGENGGAAVRAGAYISDNIYTDVTVDTEGEAEVNLNLDLSDSVTVRGSTSNTGNSGVGIFFERDY